MKYYKSLSSKNNNYSMPFLAVVFSAPYVGKIFLVGPLGVLGGIYAKYYGFSLAELATVMLLARLFDAISDPLVGYYSDRLRSSVGSRKPMILAGGLMLITSSYFLFSPPIGVGLLYVSVWFVVFYCAHTLYVIPYNAWASDFTTDTQEKTLVFSVVSIGGSVGGALFYVMPLLPFFSQTDITPEVLRVSVFLSSITFLFGLFLALYFVPSGPVIRESNYQSGNACREKLDNVNPAGSVAVEIFRSPPFVIFAIVLTLMGLASGLLVGMLFIFVDAYLNLGARFAELSLWGMICAAVSVPLWYRTILFIGKIKSFLLAIGLLMVVYLSFGFLRPESTEYIELLFILLLFYFASGSMGALVGPMLCDVIDYGRLKHGVERAGIYFSVQAFLNKLQIAVGGSLGMAVSAWFGFDVNASSHSEISAFGLRVSIAWLPIMLIIFAAFFVNMFPLTEHRMAIIRRRLVKRMPKV